MSLTQVTPITISSATLAANGTTVTVALGGTSGSITPTNPTGWFCDVNGIFNPVTAASVASNTLTLTLGEPVRAGQKVRIKYDFTSIGGTQMIDSATTPAKMYYVDNFPVTNNSTVTTSLTLTSPTVGSTGLTITATVAGSTGTVNLAAGLSGSGNGSVTYTPYGFRVIVGSSPGALVPVVGASISGTTLTLTLQSVIPSGSTVTYLYSYKGGAQLWDSAGTINSLADINSATSVTNSSTVTAQYFNDTFNDTNGTNLSAHTPNTGTSWIAAATSMVVRNGAQSGTANTHFVSNAASPGLAANFMLASPDPSYNNYRVTGDLYIKSLLNSAATFYARTNSATTTGYSLAFNPNSKLLTVSKLSGSFPTGVTNTFSLSSTTFAAGQTYSMALEVLDGYTHDSRGGSSVGSVTVTAGGSGYTSNPTPVINGGNSGGLSAIYTAARTANAVSSVSINGNQSGSGYWLVPSVSFTGGSGTGATATANLTQGRPVTIISVYWATGAQQALTTPVLTIIDDTVPTQAAGKVGISSINDGPSTGIWHANFHIDYGCHGYTPVQPQYQYVSDISEGSYPYSTFNATVGALPALDGIPPYSYSLYRNTAMTTSGAILISSLGSSPATLFTADTPTYSQSLYYYYFLATDSAGNTAQAFHQKNLISSQVTQFTSIRRDTPLNLYLIGDSTTTSGAMAPVMHGILSRVKAPRQVNGTSDTATAGLIWTSYIQGQSGSNTAGWVKGQAFYNTAVAAINSLHCSVVQISLGENDVRDGQTYNSYVDPATYGANLSNIASNLLIDCGAGAGGNLQKVIIQYPHAAIPDSYANGNVWSGDIRSRMLAYRAQIDALHNGTTIFAGDSGITDFLEQSPTGMFADGVHGDIIKGGNSWYGQEWFGFSWGNSIARILYPATNVSTNGMKRVSSNNLTGV